MNRTSVQKRGLATMRLKTFLLQFELVMELLTDLSSTHVDTGAIAPLHFGKNSLKERG